MFSTIIITGNCLTVFWFYIFREPIPLIWRRRFESTTESPRLQTLLQADWQTFSIILSWKAVSVWMSQTQPHSGLLLSGNRRWNRIVMSSLLWSTASPRTWSSKRLRLKHPKTTVQRHFVSSSTSQRRWILMQPRAWTLSKRLSKSWWFYQTIPM